MSKTPHDIAQEIVQITRQELNEADTRHRVIDVVLHEVLSWPRSAVLCEHYVAPGFSDYVLVDQSGAHILFVEAKKEGQYFELPRPGSKIAGDGDWVQMKTLLTCQDVDRAIRQVRDYCLNTGCEYACVTNGHEWILFRTFAKGKDWRDLSAFVIRSLRWFDSQHIKARSLLAYSSIVDEASLGRAFDPCARTFRARFYPKESIPAYDYDVTSNYLAPALRPIALRYLGKMDVKDADFVDRCYVRRFREASYVHGVTRSIDDVLTPYFSKYNVKEFFEDRGGGALEDRISSSARDRRTRDVVVLFGGKGSGKSTFIKKILFHRPPPSIEHFARVAVVDLLECPENAQAIEARTWELLIQGVDTDHLLRASRGDLIKHVFADRFEVAQRQVLAGLDTASDAYNVRLNDLVKEWLSDHKYCAERIAAYWVRRRKGLIVVIDNTDQFSPSSQDLCFTIAHDISTRLDCLVVISMREERFHNSRIHGTLDAFQNSGFHLPSPNPSSVFVRRLLYLMRILGDPAKIKSVSPGLNENTIAGIKVLCRIYIREFRSLTSHLREFISACAHGNMRLALEFFNQFLLSGYTRVEEMIDNPSWTLQSHQVLRPMMVPDRFFYSETKSSVPNILQPRSESSGSHFTAVRILTILARGSSSQSPVYVPLATLRARFAESLLLDDMEKNLGVLLRSGMIESSNRLDDYDPSVDDLRLTSFGSYVLNTLVGSFTYLELVSLDCGLHDEAVSRSFAWAANREYDLFSKGDKAGRVAVRIKRVDEFMAYLEREEAFERGVRMWSAEEAGILQSIKDKYRVDRDRVVRSATRNYGHLNL